MVIKPKLYLETTIPSYLVSKPSRDLRLAADQEQTLEWWEEQRVRFEIFISAVVLREVSKGNPEMSQKRVDALSHIPILSLTEESEELTIRLLDEVIPASAADDAAHIAIAAVHRMDFLLTWNCKHINNRYTIRRIEQSCMKMGFTCPVIATPTELMTIEL
jgi:hypothetical protein